MLPAWLTSHYNNKKRELFCVCVCIMYVWSYKWVCGPWRSIDEERKYCRTGMKSACAYFRLLLFCSVSPYRRTQMWDMSANNWFVGWASFSHDVGLWLGRHLGFAGLALVNMPGFCLILKTETLTALKPAMAYCGSFSPKTYS